ncbi:MAG: phage antirepressor [Peptococcaceae bacterium]|nr:phage antirepressor [Peptococcaceae bacterium]
MQNTMQVFENKDFGKIRTMQISGEPWFVGKDVATILGYERPTKAVQDHVDSEDRDGIPIQDSIGRMQNTPIINESGLYSLMLKSKLPLAKDFKRWVTSEVLPSIRKHGAYLTEEMLCRIKEDGDYISDLIDRLTAEKAKTGALLGYVEEAAPKVRYCDIILRCPEAVQVSIIAKDYGMGAAAFNKMLHRLGVQFRIGKTWLLYQKHQGFGYTLTNTYMIDGRVASMHTCWTQRGRFWLYGLLKSNGILPVAERMTQMTFAEVGA